MSITEELRKYIAMHSADWGMQNHVKGINAIADRIDAEHAKAVERAYGEGVMSVPIALDESQWVKLPVDADGVPIRVGDELTNGEDLPAKVWALMLAGDGWWCKSGESSILVAPSDLRHVKPDSWERIMDDAEKLARGDNAAVMDLVERCRRLAERKEAGS